MKTIKALLAKQLWYGSKFDVGHLLLAITFVLTYMPFVQQFLDAVGLQKYDVYIPEAVKVLTALKLMFKQWAPDSDAAAKDAAKAPPSAVAAAQKALSVPPPPK
jgi:hypothetical protein